MNIKLRRFLKKVNFIRAQRFWNRGWAQLGGVIQHSGGLFGAGPVNETRARQYAKRANWIYNVCEGHGVFKGTV